MSATAPRRKWKLDPGTLRKIKRFRQIRRGYVSFWILCVLILAAAMGPLLVGNRALAVRHNGNWVFPVLSGFHSAESLGMSGGQECDYRLLKLKFGREGGDNRVWMPPVPYNGVEVAETVEIVRPDEKGVFIDPVKKAPIDNGKVFTIHENGRRHRVFGVVNGLLHGGMTGFDPLDHVVERARWVAGRQVAWRVTAPGGAPSFAGLDPAETLYYQIPFPSAPGVGGHLLGTDDSGRDVLARLFYGFRIVIVASLIFLVFVYTIGISIGCAMGYFGGWFDLLVQRFIEIWSEIPFLYMVIILSSVFSPNLFMLLVIMISFSWMGMTFFMRTATYREKARDYVAAAKLIGASTPRILFRHVLPNTLSMIVTFVPFTVAGVITSLTALDFLGFGLPPTEPSWGEMLRVGTQNFEKPWIFGSGFAAMVTVLVLITFVGEAIREAFDPRKFTVYK